MEFRQQGATAFAVYVRDQLVLEHNADRPLFHVGTRQPTYHMHLGHFIIDRQGETKVRLDVQSIEEITPSQIYRISFVDEARTAEIKLKFTLDNDSLRVEFPSSTVSDYIRSVIEDESPVKRDCNAVDDSDPTNLWLSLVALPFAEETVRGAGMQYTTGDLRRQVLPIWVSEWYHDQLHPEGHAGPRPAAHTTYHPQPMFVSSRGYTFYAYGSAYAQFDFSDPNRHQLYFAAMPYRLEWRLSPPRVRTHLPEWLQDGIILGMQGGTDVVEGKLRTMHDAGTRIAGVWAQDWCGKRITSFGKRVFWNWQWNEEWYPHLKEKIVQWQRDYNGCRFLVYINPYIAADGSLFREADEQGFLVRHLHPDDSVYLIDFGEFNGAVVDLTNPEAFEWYKMVIRRHLLDLGISGWMADFGEYLPCDIRVHANLPGALVHNLWPILWARCNYEAIRDAGKSDEAVFFMRSGYLNVQRFCPLFWTGDQAVNFSEDAGLPAGIRSLLSLSSSGVPCVHMDIGGYFGRVTGRTREVLLRWCETSAFNIVMRTHEGNRPTLNVQFDSDPFCVQFVARMSRVHAHLKPYALHVLGEADEHQRPCLVRHTDMQYFFGSDLLVAPVVSADKETWPVIIPEGEWTHVWTGKAYGIGEHEVEAPLGQPPVFYRATSTWRSLFEQLREL